MPKAIKSTEEFTFAITGLGNRGESIGSIKQQTTDGDTINVRLMGNFGVRLLGVDAPESRAVLPNSEGEGEVFRTTDSEEWIEFLSNPFLDIYPKFETKLDPELLDHLNSKLGVNTAANHFFHAKQAERALEDEISEDVIATGSSLEDFQFFIAFAKDILDRYGRFLGYVNRNQPESSPENPRPLSYNERLLRKGLVLPYFIWPNINPFREKQSLVDAVFAPNQLREVAESDLSLSRARNWIRSAREEKSGIFSDINPLQLEPFELRFLARRQPPSRFLIDLSSDSDQLLAPQEYWRVEKQEDRLFIPPEYAPLFRQAGWR
jgi:endonuclease YncB( thermonuclease family)